MADVDSKEEKFRDWYGDVSSTLDIDPDPYAKEHYYNYPAFYDAVQSGEAVSPDKPGGHWSSQFKADDHPRRFLLDPETGRMFDSHSGAYTGGEQEMVPQDRMDRLNDMDLPDLEQADWVSALAGADKPEDEFFKE